MDKQLYSLRTLELPYASLVTSNGRRPQFQKIENFPFMYWPGKTPCEPVNMYLLAIAHRTTGDTLRTYAGELSPLVRYCSLLQISFAALADEHFFEFANGLQTEKSMRDSTQTRRNRNTVRTILSTSIRFLFWYQNSLMSLSQLPLIGLEGSGARIIVDEKIYTPPNMKRSFRYYVHSAMPPRDSREPKHPISLKTMEGLEIGTNNLALRATQKSLSLASFRSNPELAKAQIQYMKIRRHFIMWLMKRTGLRPVEMSKMTISANANILRTKKLVIPTAKRRRVEAPLRLFPIELKDALIFQRFVVGRGVFLKVLDSVRGTQKVEDTLLVGVNGLPIQKDSLRRDFSRLAQASGFEKQEACFSMFRHRFITLEVVVHFKVFMEATGKGRKLMTETDYESILKRVAAKTGHGDPRSLWHYIDLAWDEIKVWGNIDKAIERWHASDRLFEELLVLHDELTSIKNSPKVHIDVVTKRLEEILDIPAFETSAS